MLVSEKVLEKEFKGNSMKGAYMKACKWVATNVLAINNSKNITYKIVKQIKNGRYTGNVVLYVLVTAEEKDVLDKNCKICKETGKMFYIAEQKHKCESCRIMPYRKRIEDKLKNIKESMKGTIL